MSSTDSVTVLARWSDGTTVHRDPGCGGGFDFTSQETTSVRLTFSKDGLTFGKDGIDSTVLVVAHQGVLSVLSYDAALGGETWFRRRLSWLLCSTLPARILDSAAPRFSAAAGLPVVLPAEVASRLDPASETEVVYEKSTTVVQAKSNVLARFHCMKIAAALSPSWSMDLGGWPTIPDWPVPGMTLSAKAEDHRGNKVGLWLVCVQGNSNPVGAGSSPGRAVRSARFLVLPSEMEQWLEQNTEPGELVVDTELPLLLDEVPDFWLGRS